MPKLATPVQYDPALEGLNDIRPLQLVDEVIIVIPYPVLCKNPPSRDRPAIGKLARCSQQGALLKSLPVWADTIFEDDFSIGEVPPWVHYVFPNRVKAVLAIYEILVGAGGVDWTDDTYTQHYKGLSVGNYTFLPFVGKDIYFNSSGSPGYNLTVYLIGFY